MLNNSLLRPILKEDLDQYYTLLNSTSPECDKFVGGKKTITKKQFSNYLNRITTDSSREDYFILNNGKIIGEVVLNEMSNNGSANIRIAIYQENNFNKGFGKKAMSQVIRRGFEDLKLHRIELQVYSFNTRAIHVYEQLGFKKEGILRDYLKLEGHYHDAIIMSMLEDEKKTSFR